MTKGTMIYDDIDMSNSYRSGYWIGFVAGICSMFLLCLMVGLYVKT